MIEEILRDVTEDDASRLPNQRHRTECDQAVAGADIEDNVARVDVSVLQHSVTDRAEKLERPSLLLCVARVASREDPLGPLVPR
jgi:hypothetical protein